MEKGYDKLTLSEGLCWEWTPDLLTLLPTSALDVYYAVQNMNAFPLYIMLILVGWFVDVGQLRPKLWHFCENFDASFLSSIGGHPWQYHSGPQFWMADQNILTLF